MTITVSSVKPMHRPIRGRASRQLSSSEGGEMLAEERHPQPPQRVGAGKHHFHLPAGMLAGMVGERQRQHVLEIIGKHQVAALMRQAIGEPGDQCAGDNNEQAETDPGADERRQRVRGRPDVRGQRARERVDDTAEQHRLDELRPRQPDIGERECQHEPRVATQQPEYATINADEGHELF
jgi:hypothetical protein